ncbi:hypothetical protein Tco_1452584, partial [Tanacetum coccineum]
MPCFCFAQVTSMVEFKAEFRRRVLTDVVDWTRLVNLKLSDLSSWTWGILRLSWMGGKKGEMGEL